MIKEKAIERLNFYAERARKNVLSELECQWDDLSIVDQSTISVSIIEGLKSGVNLSQEFYGHEIEDLSDIHPIQ